MGVIEKVPGNLYHSSNCHHQHNTIVSTANYHMSLQDHLAHICWKIGKRCQDYMEVWDSYAVFPSSGELG